MYTRIIHLERFGFADQSARYYPGPFSVGPAVIIGAICADGKQRNARCSDRGADTFFSIPARVSVGGKTVSGYVTWETLDGWTTESESDPAVWKFRRYDYGKNAPMLPAGEWRRLDAVKAGGN